MNCKICDYKTSDSFNVRILNKYNADYYFCNNCKYIFAADPFWLEEAYQSAINISDTGILERNIIFSKIVSVLIYFFFNNNKKFLDYAGGYGIFTRLMRDIGFDFYWHDPFSKNLLARGFEVEKNFKEKFEAVTAFEVFEHLSDPAKEVEEMLKFSDTIIFSTEIFKTENPPPAGWWYYGFDHGQHISFFSEKSLSFLSGKFNLHYYTVKGLHIFSAKKLNKILLNAFLNFYKAGIFYLVKAALKSRTWEDHINLKSREK